MGGFVLLLALLTVALLALLWNLCKTTAGIVQPCPICGSRQVEAVHNAPSLVRCIGCGVERHRSDNQLV